MKIGNEYLWTDILDFCYLLEEIVNADKYVDKRKWLPLFYGNRLGFLPYETEEEKQAILKDPRFFGYFDKDGKALFTRETSIDKPTKKNKFTLEL